jgi:hypothetical protein
VLHFRNCRTVQSRADMAGRDGRRGVRGTLPQPWVSMRGVPDQGVQKGRLVSAVDAMSAWTATICAGRPAHPADRAAAGRLPDTTAAVRTAVVAAARSAVADGPRHALAVSGCGCPDGCGSVQCPDPGQCPLCIRNCGHLAVHPDGWVSGRDTAATGGCPML